MSLYSALSTGVSGVSGQTRRFATISDNVSNVNTTGYKTVRTEFSTLVVDLMRPNAYSSGAICPVVHRDVDRQGQVQTTAQATDLAIAGNGLFAVKESLTATEFQFTRAGSFDVNSEGYLQNKAGKFLLAYPAAADGSPGAVAAASAQPVNVTQLILSAKPTSEIRATVNLPADIGAAAADTAIDAFAQGPAATATPSAGVDVALADRTVALGDRYAATLTSGGTTRTYETLAAAGATVDQIGQALVDRIAADFAGATYTAAGNRVFVPGIGAADIAVAAQSGYRTPLTVFDGLGNAHKLDATWTKVSAAGQWSVAFAMPTLNGTPSATSMCGGPIDVTFMTSGTVAAGSATGATLSIAWDPAVANAGSSTVAVDFGDSTAYGETYEVATLNQNGAGVGRVSGVEVETDGAIRLLFTNGQSKTLGHVALATFPNVDGLMAESGNAFRESVASGIPTFAAAGRGGAGSVVGQALEASTVDIAAELSDMIVTQNAYAANVKTITTADEMLKVLDRMKQ